MDGSGQTRLGVWSLFPVALTAAYPFAAFVGVRSGHLSATAWIVLSVVLVQLPALKKQGASKSTWLAALAAAVAALSAATFGQANLLLVLPALTNFALAAVFGGSLRGGPSLIERFARRQDADLSAEKASYCRRATQVWTSFFICNAILIISLSACAPLSWWALYTGVLSHALALSIGLTELLLRIRKFGLGAAGPRVRSFLLRLTAWNSAARK